MAISYLQLSGLPNDVLGRIWQSCKSTDSRFPDLLETEFVNMMNQAAQYLKEYDWFIPDIKKEKYDRELTSIGTYHGHVRKMDVYSFVKVNIKLFSMDLFEQLFKLVDINNVENLTPDQFYVLRHIVDEYVQGISIPTTIPIKVLGTVAIEPINTMTRTGAKASTGHVLAEEYWNKIQSTESINTTHTSSETINSEFGGDLEQDIKALKDNLLYHLDIPDELKGLEFDGNLYYSLMLQEMMEINEKVLDADIAKLIADKNAKIRELEDAIQKEKMTML